VPLCESTHVAATSGSNLRQSRNLVYFLIFLTVELAFGLVAASYLALADGAESTSTGLKKAGGAFGFISGMLGYYTLGHLMCQEALFFAFPMGDTSRYFKRWNRAKHVKET
jgi:uncharacterized protein